MHRSRRSVLSTVGICAAWGLLTVHPGSGQWDRSSSQRPGVDAERSEAEREAELEARKERRDALVEKAEAIMAETVGARLSPRTIVPSGDYALSVDTDFELGGYIFKDGYPLLHDHYPGARNIALGRDAMVSLTPYVPLPSSGTNNSAFGSYALRNTTEGRNNTAVGAYALHANDYGYSHAALGAFALYSSTMGVHNTAIGASALFSATLDSSRNTAVGAFALLADSYADGLTAVGFAALMSNQNGYSNTAVGDGALTANTNGDDNTAVGALALSSITIGNGNTALGSGALSDNETGRFNTAVGSGALADATGYNNVAVGAGALALNTTGRFNVAVGTSTLNATTGSFNIGLGDCAGCDVVGGDHNILIGSRGESADAGVIRVGGSSQTATYIEGIFGATSSAGAQVFINSDNQLGTVTSSRRFKEDIEPMGNASAELLDLRPVTFRYTEKAVGGGARPVEFGLIAEEVAEVDPNLVVYGETGEPYSVRYHALTPMLVNELQQLRREVEERGDQVDRLLAMNAELQARLQRLEEQRSRARFSASR